MDRYVDEAARRLWPSMDREAIDDLAAELEAEATQTAADQALVLLDDIEQLVDQVRRIDRSVSATLEQACAATRKLLEG